MCIYYIYIYINVCVCIFIIGTDTDGKLVNVTLIYEPTYNLETWKASACTALSSVALLQTPLVPKEALQVEDRDVVNFFS